jgi:hypothetical protein
MISHNPIATYPTFKQGNSYKLNLQVLNQDTRLPVPLIDITAITYRMTESNILDAVIHIEKTLGAGIEVIDDVLGIVEITLEGADTRTLPRGRLYHECLLRTAIVNATTILDEIVFIEEQRILL